MRISYLFAILFGILVSSCTNAPEKEQTAKEFFDTYYQKNEQMFLKGVRIANPQMDSTLAKAYFECIMDYYFSVDSNFVYLEGEEFAKFVKVHEEEVLQHCGKLNEINPTNPRMEIL